MIEKFVFASDMHFDEGDTLDPKFRKGVEKMSPEWLRTVFNRETRFISHFVTEYLGSTLILAGDFYCEIELTLKFIERLEKMKITGFFILGNHEFRTKTRFSRAQLSEYCAGMTSENKYFKYLETGVKYYCNDYCIIGDVAWPHSVDPVLFKSWTDFAESVATSEPKILVVTHFPMKDVTIYSNSAQIFGHLHVSSTKNTNHFSSPYLHEKMFGVIK